MNYIDRITYQKLTISAGLIILAYSAFNCVMLNIVSSTINTQKNIYLINYRWSSGDASYINLVFMRAVQWFSVNAYSYLMWAGVALVAIWASYRYLRPKTSLAVAVLMAFGTYTDIAPTFLAKSFLTTVADDKAGDFPYERSTFQPNFVAASNFLDHSRTTIPSELATKDEQPKPEVKAQNDKKDVAPYSFQIFIGVASALGALVPAAALMWLVMFHFGVLVAFFRTENEN